MVSTVLGLNAQDLFGSTLAVFLFPIVSMISRLHDWMGFGSIQFQETIAFGKIHDQHCNIQCDNANFLVSYIPFSFN